MTTPIVMFDYLVQYRSIEVEVLEAVRGVLESGQLVLGPEVEAFEKAFASYLAEGGGAVGVNSGTDAIAIALRALDIRAGDEVVTVANTAVPTVSAIREVGAIPVFCDVEPDTALIDLRKLEACINSRTRAIVPVHLFGNVVDVPAIMELIGSRSISVVEDCAQAHGGKLSARSFGRHLWVRPRRFPFTRRKTWEPTAMPGSAIRATRGLLQKCAVSEPTGLKTDTAPNAKE